MDSASSDSICDSRWQVEYGMVWVIQQLPLPMMNKDLESPTLLQQLKSYNPPPHLPKSQENLTLLLSQPKYNQKILGYSTDLCPISDYGVFQINLLHIKKCQYCFARIAFLLCSNMFIEFFFCSFVSLLLIIRKELIHFGNTQIWIVFCKTPSFINFWVNLIISQKEGDLSGAAPGF